MSIDALNLLDAQTTDPEWERNKQRSKLLHDCKTKGFPALRRNGLLVLTPKKEVTVEASMLTIAQKGAALVNGGMSITKAAKECGVAVGSLAYYCKKANIELKPEFKRRAWDYKKVTKQVIKFVNEDGYRLAGVARKLDCNNALIVNALKSEGYKYNARTVQIERIEKS